MQLDHPFLAEKIKCLSFKLMGIKTPGPDGVPAYFFPASLGGGSGGPYSFSALGSPTLVVFFER